MIKIIGYLTLSIILLGCAKPMIIFKPVTENDELLVLHNKIREKSGLDALTLDSRLSKAALKYCMEIYQTKNYSHVGTDGSTPGKRATAAGYSWRSIGENLGRGYETAEIAVMGWEHSPRHFGNIVEPAFTEAGFAHCSPENYWVVMFAKPK